MNLYKRTGENLTIGDYIIGVYGPDGDIEYCEPIAITYDNIHEFRRIPVLFAVLSNAR